MYVCVLNVSIGVQINGEQSALQIKKPSLVCSICPFLGVNNPSMANFKLSKCDVMELEFGTFWEEDFSSTNLALSGLFPSNKLTIDNSLLCMGFT